MNYQKTDIATEDGIVSLIVTLIIMLIISVTVIGFAQLMRREQRQVLDRQLNTQAFYAAESGVNDAVAYLKTDPTYVKSDCSGTLPAPYNNPKLDFPAGTISYSCILVNPSPTTLEYTNINTDKSQVIPVISNPRGQVRNIYISWQSATTPSDFNGCTSGSNVPSPSFPANWPSCPGILRVDIVPIPSNGNPFSRDDLIGNVQTLFLYPLKNNGSGFTSFTEPASGFGNQGGVKGIACSAPTGVPGSRQCKAEITGFGTGSDYYLRIKSIYKASSVTIAADNGCTPGPCLLPLVGAQAVVDATGKANDVLKRIQVRVPVSPLDGYFPEYNIDSLGSICKLLQIAPPSTVVVAPTANGDLACNP